jgi:hypothetical protein
MLPANWQPREWAARFVRRRLSRSNEHQCNLRRLLTSGIQEQDGGVARYVRADTGVNAQVSSEITAYFLSSLLFLKFGEFQHARSAARYLRETAWNAERQLLLFEKPTSKNPPAGYFFDSGIAGLSLFEMWRITGEDRFLVRAIEIGRSMARDFRTSPGSFAAVLTLPSKAVSQVQDRWSTKPGCYQLKPAVIWHRILEHACEPMLAGLYESAVARALDDSRSFLSNAESDQVMDRLHAFLYFLEGLLPVATVSQYADEIEKGIAKVDLHLSAAAPRFARSDVYAQLLRLRLLAFSVAGVPLDRHAIDQGVKHLLEFQITATDPRLDGAFAFGTKLGRNLPFANPVSTIFAVQALSFWLDLQTGAIPYDWRILI